MSLRYPYLRQPLVIDENLSDLYVDMFKRVYGFSAENTRTLCGKKSAPDLEILEAVGNKDAILLSCDNNMTINPLEREALGRFRVRYVLAVAGFQSKRLHDQFWMVFRSWQKIMEELERGPCILQVDFSRNRIRRIDYS